MAELDIFLQEYADWAKNTPDDQMAEIRLTLTFPFLTYLASAHHLIPCRASWEARGRFRGIAAIYNSAEDSIGDLTVNITPPAAANISNHIITLGSTIGFKFELSRPKWEKSVMLKTKDCQPPYVLGWIDLDRDRQPAMLRFDHRELRPAR